jgi:hypothetical protein
MLQISVTLAKPKKCERLPFGKGHRISGCGMPQDPGVDNFALPRLSVYTPSASFPLAIVDESTYHLIPDMPAASTQSQ